MGLNYPEKSTSCTFKQATQPSILESTLGDTWYDTTNQILYIFNGISWKKFIGNYGSCSINYGCVFGGLTGTVITNKIETYQFDLDGRKNLQKTLLYPSYRGSACNSSKESYLFNGMATIDGLAYNRITRINYNFEASIEDYVANRPGISPGISFGSSFNSSLHGFCCGGQVHSSTTLYSFIHRIGFSNPSGENAIVGNLSMTKYQGAGLNSSTHGYDCGGSTSGGTHLKYINRVGFPFDSGTATNVGQSVNALFSGGYNSSLHGFMNSIQSYIEKITFPHNAGTFTTTRGCQTSRMFYAGMKSSINGYALGGLIVGTTQTSSVEKIIFPFNSGTSNYEMSLSENKDETMGSDITDFNHQFV